MKRNRVLRNHDEDFPFWRLLPLLLAPLLFCIMSIWSIYRQQTGPLPVKALASRGAIVMIMRFPATPSGTQEQIRFNENNDRIPTSRLAGRGPAFTVDAHEQNSTVLQLSPAQWQVVDQVRTAWCARPPDVPKPQPDEMFYDIGINCGGLWPRRLQIPAHAPPAELLTLIDLVPPPAPTPPAPVEGDEP